MIIWQLPFYCDRYLPSLLARCINTAIQHGEMEMKKLWIAIPLLASTLALAACEGSIANAVSKAGKSTFKDGIAISTDDTDPGEFDGVSLAGPDNVVFATGSSYTIRAEGDDDAIEQLRYKVKEGQLKIGRERDGLWDGSTGAAIVYVSAPSLKNAKLLGSGDMQVDSMTTDSTKLSIAGSGDINVAKIETASLKTSIAGSGNVTMAGTANSAKISIAGSGDITGKGLNVENAKISIAGSGDVELSSDGAVDAKVMGSGDIRVHGDAKCTSKAMGSGEIKCGA